MLDLLFIDNIIIQIKMTDLKHFILNISQCSPPPRVLNEDKSHVKITFSLKNLQSDKQEMKISS